MRREYLEIFAVFFSFLVLLQDAHALVRRNTHREFDDDFNKVTDTQIRKKRGQKRFVTSQLEYHDLIRITQIIYLFYYSAVYI